LSLGSERKKGESSIMPYGKTRSLFVKKADTVGNHRKKKGGGKTQTGQAFRKSEGGGMRGQVVPGLGFRLHQEKSPHPSEGKERWTENFSGEGEKGPFS